MRKVAELAALLLCIIAAPAFAKFDPSFTWFTIETSHFVIHFHQGEEDLARRAAVIVEEAHARLVPRIKWEPTGKTHFVFVDNSDFGGGMTQVIPYRNIIITVTPMRGVFGFREDWLRAAITHEYTHLLHLDMVHGIPATLQSIFGRFYFPNHFQPAWMIEGLADYEMNEHLYGGQRPYPDMVLRMAALEGPFPTIDQLSTYALDAWPGFQTPYLFGESFTRYLADRFGRGRLAEVAEVYSGRGVPFLVDATGKSVLRHSYDDLWSDWKEALSEQYRKQRETIDDQGMTGSVRLTQAGYMNIDPAFSPDGSRIAYTSANADESWGISIMGADGAGARRLVDNYTLDGGLSWSPDGTLLYYTKLDAWRVTNAYNDIYCYDLAKTKEYRITEGLRARDPDLSPDGASLVFVVGTRAMNRLASAAVRPGACLPLDERRIIYLTAWGPNQYTNPRYSPDGSRIAVAVSRLDGNSSIWLIDRAGTKLAEVADDRAIESAVSWSPDGRYLYFSSDRTGISNLFAYDVERRTIHQVSNVLGGAFMPDPSPDGKTLAYSSYSARGFDIHTMGVDPASWKAAESHHDPYPPLLPDAQPDSTPDSPYSPLSTVYPRYWLPWFGGSAESGTVFGAFTFGQDVLRRHQYYATALYGPESRHAWYTLDYFYDGWYPTMRLSAADTDVTHSGLLSDPLDKRDYVERERKYELWAIIPFAKIKQQHLIFLGYRLRELSHLTDIPPWTGYGGPAPAEGAFASGFASYRFNNSRRFGYSISPEQGRTVEMGYERLDRSLGSDVEMNKYTLDWHEFIDLPWRHQVLQVRAFAGASTGDLIAQRAFQLGGNFPGDIALAIDQQQVYLRGYPANEFRGQKAALASLEYRFPVKNLEKGWSSKALFLERLHGAIFFDAGSAWDGTFHRSYIRRSVGVEARFDVVLGYLFPVTVNFGIAAGLDEQGELIPTVTLWAPFW